MGSGDHRAADNLKDLRRQLASRLALLMIGASGLAMWFTLPRKPFPIVTFGLLAAPLGLGLGVRALTNTRPALARHLLVSGLTAGLLIGMWLSHEPWLPFLGSPLTFVSAMLVSGSEVPSAGLIAVAAVWLTHSGSRAYHLPGLFFALALGIVLAWLAVRTLYTALDWAWTMQERSDRLLEVARDRQAELGRTLKSLDLTNTLLRRTQRELIAARKQAEEARRMKERFAANISHELRTPLNLILGFSEVMYLSPEVYGKVRWPPTLRRDVYQIYRSSRHLLEMIEDILTLSRFEMVGFTLNKEPTPLEPLLRDTVEIAEDLFRGKPVRLEMEIAQDLPTLEIDRTRIRQVLLNLLNNAQRFTEKGRVLVRAERANGEVVISISDTGPGIPADRLPHLFEEFYQIDYSLRRSHQGAGLGLAISKRFVQAHEGYIWAESEEGVGSTFFFTLPIPGQYTPVAQLHMTRLVEPSWPEPRACVLVADPDPTVAALLRRHLEDYEVVQVENADRLAEEVMLHHPRAVVYNVPPGEQENCDDAPMPVPLIECSLPSQAWALDNLTPAACLTKPITAQQLLQEIERLTDARDVLIVDDDRGFCQLVERMLETTGKDLTLRHAYSGEDGLSAMQAQRPDLVLLDLIMPEVDGLQVLEEMRRTPDLADVPVLVLTATNYVEDALAQHSSQVVIRRPDGLRLDETLRCLQAVINVLEPRYDERLVPEETASTGHG